ncbi:hypothetical protein P9112_006569 [Eukaryota sp. TZLM1-RC]
MESHVEVLYSMYPEAVSYSYGVLTFDFGTLNDTLDGLFAQISLSNSSQTFHSKLSWSSQPKHVVSALDHLSTNNTLDSLLEYILSVQEAAVDVRKSIASQSKRVKDSLEYPFTIIKMPSFTDRKSTFQAFVSQCHSMEDCQLFINCLLQDSKIAAATHNVLVARFCVDGQLHVRADDDGEQGASMAMLNLLEKTDVVNIICVVTRWFGGILLGPTRFRHFVSQTRDAVQEARNRGLVDD